MTDKLIEAYRIIEELPVGFSVPPDADETSAQKETFFRTLRLLDHQRVWFMNISRTTYELFFTSRIEPALVLTKSLMEASAFAHMLMDRVLQANARGSIGNSATSLRALLLDCHSQITQTGGLNHAPALLEVERKNPGFKADYDLLCRQIFPYLEIWQGQFGNDDRKPHESPMVSDLESPGEIGARCFVRALSQMRYSLQQCQDGMTTFARICAGPGHSRSS